MKYKMKHLKPREGYLILGEATYCTT